MKLLIYLFVCAPFFLWATAWLKGKEYNQPLFISVAFLVAICTLAICDSIEKLK